MKKIIFGMMLSTSTVFGQIAPDRVYIEPTGPLIAQQSMLAGFDVTRAITLQKGCPLVVTRTPKAGAYVLRYEGGFNWTIFLDGDVISVFRIWPVYASKAAKKTCEIIEQRRRN